MDIHIFIQTFNQTMGTSFYLEALPNQASPPAISADFFSVNHTLYCLMSENDHQDAAQKELLSKLYHALTNLHEDPLLTYLTGKSPLIPDQIKAILSPTRLIFLKNLSGTQTDFNESVLGLAAQLLTIIWSSPYESEGLMLLVEETSQLSDTLEAYCDTLASDYGILTQLILSPHIIHHNLLPAYFKLIEQMRLVGPSRPGVLQFNAIIVELVARSLLENDSTLPLTQYMPLETLSLLMDEEIIKTADQFFKNNLNITDTAKAMYLHRNTLLYRLDKIQKVTGFDLREFEDSWYFKLLLAILRLNVT